MTPAALDRPHKGSDNSGVGDTGCRMVAFADGGNCLDDENDIHQGWDDTGALQGKLGAGQCLWWVLGVLAGPNGQLLERMSGGMSTLLFGWSVARPWRAPQAMRRSTKAKAQQGANLVKRAQRAQVQDVPIPERGPWATTPQKPCAKRALALKIDETNDHKLSMEGRAQRSKMTNKEKMDYVKLRNEVSVACK